MEKVKIFSKQLNPKELGIHTIGFTGISNTKFCNKVDTCIILNDKTNHIQEIHVQLVN